MFSDEAIHVYVDGSYARATRLSAYGWVVANPRGEMARARAVLIEEWPGKSASVMMEAAAFIDAVAEFAPRRRHIVIHGDCQALSGMVDKYRAGLMEKPDFFDLTWLREEDAWRLLSLIDTVSFEFRWVKAHSGVFHNSVVDNALRYLTVESRSEAEALKFAHNALDQGRLVGRCRTAAQKRAKARYRARKTGALALAA